MADQKWEIDLEALTVDDLVLMDEAGQGLTGRMRDLKAMLNRVVSNRTEEEIGKLTIRELNALCEDIGKAVQEAALPKETESASKTS